jgi:hypothetical protein
MDEGMSAGFSVEEMERYAIRWKGEEWWKCRRGGEIEVVI